MITRQNDFISKVCNRSYSNFGLLIFFFFFLSKIAFAQPCVPVIEYTTPEAKLEGCSPFSIYFKDPNNSYSRLWDFGDGTQTSTSATPFHVFKSGKLGDTTYTITLTKNCNGGTQTTLNIKVFAPPKVNFKLDTTSVCAITDKVKFTNLSDIGTYNWSFGDNTSSTLREPIKIYTLGGIYDVKLTVKNTKGCEEDTIYQKLMTVNALPSPEFLLDKYSGCVPFQVNISNITDTVDVPIKEWNWSFSGEAPASNIINPSAISFKTPGYKNISLSVKSDVGCTSTTSNIVHVITTPKANFILSKDAFCSSDSTQITFSGTSGPNAKYTWNFNGGTSISTGVGPHWVKWSKGGVKSIQLDLVDSTCNATYSSNVTIQTSPVITLKSSTDTICDFEEIIFNAEPKSLVDYKFYKNGQVVQEGDQFEYNSDQIFDKDVFYVVGLDAKGCSSSRSNYKPIKVKAKPIVSLSSSDFDNIICDSDEVRFTGVPNSYKGYTFFNFSNPLQRGIASEFKTNSIRTNDSIFVEATNLNGCKKTSSNAFIFKVVERISKPVVHCGKSTNTQVNFNWDPLPEAVGYEISINGGAYQSPSNGANSLSHLVTGLNDGDPVKMVVKALGSFSCGTSIASDTLTCYAKSCEPLPIKYLPYDTLCAGESVTLKINGLNQGNYSIAWNGEVPSYDSTYTLTPAKDSQITAYIVDSTNLTNCSYYKAIFKLKVFEIPKVSISSHIPTTNCSGSTAIIKASPPSYKRYTFYNGNQIIQDNWRDSVKIKNIKDGVPIKVVATNYGCSATSNTIVNTVIKPLTQPVVNCGTSSTSSIEFKWDAVQDAIGYEVSVDGGNWITPTSGNTGLNHILNGLTPGSASYISVRAKGATICGNSPVSLQASCFTLPCSSITFTSENSKTLCEGQATSLSISNINIPNYAVSWNTKNYSKNLSLTIKPKKDTIISISVKNLNEQNCPATIKYTRLEVIKQPDVKLTVNPTLLCNTDSLTLTAFPVDYDNYKFFNGSATLYSGQSSSYKLSMFKSSVFLKVVARNGICTDTSDVLKLVIDKPLERPIINSGNITNSSIEFVWDSVPQATGYLISVNGKPYTTPSSGILGKSHVVSGLAMNEAKYAKVIALGAGACGNSLESDTIIRKTTNHIDSVCNAITYKLTYHDSICDGDDFVARVTNLNNTTSLLSWNASFEDTISIYQIAPFKTDTLSVTIRRTDEPLCPGVKKLVRITVNPKPNVTLSTSISNDSICEQKEITFFASPSGYENYTFRSDGKIIQNSNNNEYYFSNIIKSETIDVEVTDDIGCIGYSSPLPITVVKNPVISLAANLKNGGACIGSDVLINIPEKSYNTYNFYNNGNLVQTNNSSEFIIKNLTSSYSITANAIHKFGCVGKLTSPLNITLFQLPEVSLSSNKLNNTICDGDNITITSLPSKLKNYDFYDATTNNILQSSVADNYIYNSLKSSKLIYVIAKDSNDCFSKKSIALKITVNPNPVMTNSSNLTICSNNIIEIPLTSDISSTYTWQATDNPSINGESVLIQNSNSLKDTLKSTSIIQESVNYSVIPTSLLGCKGSTQTVLIKVNPTPVIQNVFDTICSGTSFNLEPKHQLPLGYIVPSNTTYTWPIPNITAGLITGLSAQTTNLKTITQLLNNKTNSPISLTYQITPKSGAVGNCIGKPFNYSVLVNPTPEIPNYIVDSICSGETFTKSPKNGIPTTSVIVPTNTKYTWVKPIALPAGTVEGITEELIGMEQISNQLFNDSTKFGEVIYTIIPKADKCIGKSFDIPITVKPLPEITNELEKAFCSSNNVGVKITASVPSIITWSAKENLSVDGETQNNSTKDSITDLLINKSSIQQTVHYTLKPISLYACKGQEKELKIEVYAKPFINNTSVSLCNGDTLNFIPKDAENGNIVPLNTLFTWNVMEKSPSDSINGDANQNTPFNKIYQLLKTKTVSGNLKYKVFPTSSLTGNCIGDPFVLNVNIHPIPDPKLSISDTGICKGTEISINTEFDETYYPSTIYNWNTGQNTKSFTINPQQSTVFKLIVNSNGCSSNPDSVSVFVDQFVPAVNAGADETICRGDSIQLNATGGKTYSWNYDKSLSDTVIGSPKAAPYVTTIYKVKATNDFCSAEDEVLITIDRCLKELPFKIPQIYTPNEDGTNDVWELIDIDYFPKSSITIFNRWGDIVYEKTPYLNEWNGKNIVGDNLPDGTYYYVIDLGNGHELYKGFVVITR